MAPHAELPIGERRAAMLVGLSPNDLRVLARQAALGYSGAESGEMVFTYEELRQLCLLAARPND